jgi:endonuclease YncB( thermonuclease family)
MRIVLLLSFLFFVHVLLHAQSYTGKVVKVADGDTFTVLLGNNQKKRIRLHGVDCPEKGQDYGNVAKEYISNLIAGKSVIILPTKKDRYGRAVAIVKVDTTNINESLLRTGLAWHYKQYDNTPHWADLEHQAKYHHRKIWSAPNPTPPWQWRKRKKADKNS